MLVAFYDSVFLLSQGFLPAVNALLLGTLLYQSRLVPRVLRSLLYAAAVTPFSPTICFASGSYSTRPLR